MELVDQKQNGTGLVEKFLTRIVFRWKTKVSETHWRRRPALEPYRLGCFHLSPVRTGRLSLAPKRDRHPRTSSKNIIIILIKLFPIYIKFQLLEFTHHGVLGFWGLFKSSLAMESKTVFGG